MWRTVDDFWDNWSQLNYQFTVCNKWYPYIAPGTWPDADMLPLGHIAIRGERGVDRMTNFTESEQYTLMSLWSIFKSPLMFGGHLPDNDNFTKSLLTNDEVLYMHKNSISNQQWFNNGEQLAWKANDPQNGDQFVALFNTGGDGFVNTKDVIYRSGTISRLTDGYGVNIDIALPENSHQLFLIVDDGGDNYNCDHADWISPTLYLSNGDSILLTSLNWEYATAGWGTVAKNKSISGGSLNIKGTSYPNGIGTHAESIIMFNIPENCTRFKSFAGLDLGGTSQTGGATVEFMLAVTDPTPRDVDPSKAIVNTGRISRTAQREGVNISANITGAAKLYLVVTDAGDDYNYDHADWINPAIYKDNGDSLLLTDLSWESATSGWGSVQKNKSLDGNNLKVNGKNYSNGFGVNAYSTIVYNIPEGYTTFKSFCGFDDEVLNAANGVTVEFLVFIQDPAVTTTVAMPVDLSSLGFKGSCKIRDMWAKSDLGSFSGSEFAPLIVNHGAGLYRISATDRSEKTSVILNPSATEVFEGDTVTLHVKVTKPESITDTLTGWVMLYKNDTLIVTIALDSAGNITYKTNKLPIGQYSFTARYGGNASFAPQSSGNATITVKKKESAITEPTGASGFWINSKDGEFYLNGTSFGDLVRIYNIYGQKSFEFIATSNRHLVRGNGLTVITVISNHKTYTFKAILL